MKEFEIKKRRILTQIEALKTEVKNKGNSPNRNDVNKMRKLRNKLNSLLESKSN